MRLFKKKDHVKAQNIIKPIDVNFDRIDAYILEKYGLVDIAKKDVFILLNMLFMVSGIIAIVSFLYKRVNAVAVVAGIVTIGIGFVIFRMVKKYGKKFEKKEETEK